MLRKLSILFILCLLLTGCYFSEQPVDRPYGVNYNFLVQGDSVCLFFERPFHNEPIRSVTDSIFIFKGDEIVVAQIAIIPEDSIDSVWVKVARDQLTMGWVHERDLLSSVVPNDPISQFINIFSHRHLWFFLAVISGVFVISFLLWTRHFDVKMILFNDIATCYPTALTVILSGSAVLYASIQRYAPGLWVYFYYHPTLNPFGQSLALSLFLLSVWAIVMLTIASVDEVLRQLDSLDALLYLSILLGCCMVCYIVFSISTLYWFGYPLYGLYCMISISLYNRKYRPRYICGNCGCRMHNKGYCTRCGTFNK